MDENDDAEYRKMLEASVAAAPPLTDKQIARLAVLFADVVNGTDEDGKPGNSPG